ncbi:MAG TPA: NADPH:quinone oxidoreductase family protein [Bacillales bacterium]|nr:NADPH:quinone oxidoreductase family protein [Bacillales bacterium]
MKAIVVSQFGGAENLEYKEIDRPVLEENEILIRVEATGVNFADIKAREGRYHGGSNPPFIPGLDTAGTIEAVGSGVKRFRAGQRVIAFVNGGSYSEYAVADEHLTFELPDNVDFETGAACPVVAFTSYHLLHKVGRIQDGETVLIHAASGGVGTTAIQLAKILGAGKVIGTVGRDEKKEIARQAGADAVINYEKEDFVELVQQMTDGRGADLILDSIAADTGEKSMECLAMYGRMVNFGNAGGRPSNIQSKDLHASCRAVLGFSLGTTRNRRPELLQDSAEKVLQFLAEEKLKMVVCKRLPLAEAKEAHKWIENRQSTGKVILVP